MSHPAPSITPEALLAHHQWVRALARSLVRDPNEADDLVQETWLAALRNPPRQAGSIRAWLGRVLRNSARQAARSEGRRGAREHAVARPEGLEVAAADAVARVEAQRLVVARVLALGEPSRSAIVLHFFEGLSPRDISRQLGIPVGTVRARIRRALSRMRADLDQEHGSRDEWALALAPVLGPLPASPTDVTDAGTLARSTLPAVAATVVAATSRLDSIRQEIGRVTERAAVVGAEALRVESRVRDERASRGRMSTETSRLRTAIDTLTSRMGERGGAGASEAESSDNGRDASSGPRFPFLAYEDALGAVDWTEAGRRIHALIRFMPELVPIVVAEKLPPAEVVGRKQQLTAPVLELVLELRRRDFPECHGTGQLAHPAIACQTVAAVLDAADLSLSAAQSRALEAVARRYDAEDRRSRSERTGDEPVLVIGASEADARRRFLAAVMALLTDAQREALRPSVSRGLLGPDMFSAALVWQGRRTAHMVVEDRDAYGAELWSQLTADVEFEDAAVHGAVRAIFDAWLAELPQEEFTVPFTAMAKNGWHRDERLADWADRTVDLYRELERIRGSDAVLDRLGSARLFIPYRALGPTDDR
jgi:RNA polymerase sigma-70 factor (ECF subfamily)